MREMMRVKNMSNQTIMKRLTSDSQIPVECIARLNAMSPRQMAQRGFVRKSDLDHTCKPVLEVLDISLDF